MFWCYWSIGLDARASHGFHTLREAHPHLASGRVVNQMWYVLCATSTGALM